MGCTSHDLRVTRSWAAIPGGTGGHVPPIIGVGDVNGFVPPKFVVFVSMS